MIARALMILALALLASSITSCSRYHLDPNGGAETIYLRTIDHDDHFELTYLRKPEEGPLVLEKDAWTYLWFLPTNHPDLGLWLQDTIPTGAEPANVRASFKLPWYGPLLTIPTLGLVYVQRVRFEAQPVIYTPTKKAAVIENSGETPKTD
jgi:hypothetical protein